MGTEADTCRKYVVPKLQAAGWDNDPHSIAEQRYFTAGRIVVRGSRAERRKGILKPDRKKVDSRFVWHMLGSRTVFEKAWASTTGPAQPTVPLRAIRELPIPVPPLTEQRRIVFELDALQAEVDALKRLQAETAAEQDALLPAILGKAFKGEI